MKTMLQSKKRLLKTYTDQGSLKDSDTDEAHFFKIVTSFVTLLLKWHYVYVFTLHLEKAPLF